MAGTAWDNTARALTITGATVTTSNPVISVSQTWNAAGVAFIGTYTQITNTASAAGSYVNRADVGGTRVFSLDTSGNVQCNSIGPRTYARFAVSGALGVDVWGGGYLTASIGDGLSLRANVPFGWSNSNSTSNTTSDLYLYRDAAATLAQRNGTNAQTFRVYGKFTDLSNRVNAALSATSTTVTLAAETAGTGADNVPVNINAAGTSPVSFGSPAQAKSYTVATVPSASASGAGAIIYVTDESGGAVLAVSDATDWRRVTDRAVIS